MGVIEDYEYNRKYYVAPDNAAVKKVASFDESEYSLEKQADSFDMEKYDTLLDGGALGYFEKIKNKVNDIKNDVSILEEKYKNVVGKYEKFSNLKDSVDSIISRMNYSVDVMSQRCSSIMATAYEDLTKLVKTDAQFISAVGQVGTDVSNLGNAAASSSVSSTPKVTPVVPTDTPVQPVVEPTDTPVQPVVEPTDTPVYPTPPTDDPYNPPEPNYPEPDVPSEPDNPIPDIPSEPDPVDYPVNVYAPPNPTEDIIEPILVYAPPSPVVPQDVYAPPSPVEPEPIEIPVNVYAPPNPTEDITEPVNVYAPPNPTEDITEPVNVYAPPNPTEDITEPVNVYAPPNPNNEEPVINVYEPPVVPVIEGDQETDIIHQMEANDELYNTRMASYESSLVASDESFNKEMKNLSNMRADIENKYNYDRANIYDNNYNQADTEQLLRELDDKYNNDMAEISYSIDEANNKHEQEYVSINDMMMNAKKEADSRNEELKQMLEKLKNGN